MTYRALLFSALLMVSSPVLAEEDERSLMEQGAELFFEGLRNEMAPALDDLRDMAEQFGPSLRGFMVEMGPALAQLAEDVKDWSVYHPPEILPNGDIIIRKKQPTEPDTDAPDNTPDGDAPTGSTDI
ncbi:hypothetical protein QEZ52_15945 [Aliisedimentitalea scapharcae]|uniref:AAA+ family ATPase n=1 Tax=Aliisedimentitalea scapharcae TaxID=1524259 RepID=A0ABZ2XPR3_9RHOB